MDWSKYNKPPEYVWEMQPIAISQWGVGWLVFYGAIADALAMINASEMNAEGLHERLMEVLKETDEHNDKASGAARAILCTIEVNDENTVTLSNHPEQVATPRLIMKRVKNI